MAAESYATCPFTVLIDSAESQPWTFQGLKSDANKGGLPLYVPTRFACLGRHPESLGDYSIAGLVGLVAIERKSADDAVSTVLGWDSKYNIEHGTDGRRNRFIRELRNLAKLHSAIVVVESCFESILRRMPGCDGERHYDEKTGEINATRGVKSVSENRKIFHRSVTSWMQRPETRIPWMFLESRRSAEVYAFRWLEKFWQHLPKVERAEASARAAVGEWRASA